MATELADSLKSTMFRQLKLASFIVVAWLFRFLACSQLKYLNDDDLSLAIFALFDTMIIAGGVKIAESQSSSARITKSAMTVYVLFALFINVIGMVFAFETFVMFLHMFACESVAFEKMELSWDGMVHGEIQQCPWSVFDRTSNCRMNEMCPFNSRSVVMILQQHWKRHLGMSATIFTMFILALMITSFGSVCMHLSKLFVSRYNCCPVNEESSPEPLSSINYYDLPPPYPGTKENKNYKDEPSSDANLQSV